MMCSKNSSRYEFDPPLSQGIIKERKNRFVAVVEIEKREVVCHCPVTGRIGDIVLKNIPCLLSASNDPHRKTPYTVKAIALDDLDVADKNWIGIDLGLSNRIIEFFLQTHQLGEMISDYSEVQREVRLGKSKLDFLVGNTYIEVKTPLNVLHVNYGKHIQTKATMPAFTSTDRFMKHVCELANSLKTHERAILVTVSQYRITHPRQWPKSPRAAEVADIVGKAIKRGVEFFEISMNFEPDGVSLVDCKSITDSIEREIRKCS